MGYAGAMTYNGNHPRVHRVVQEYVKGVARTANQMKHCFRYILEELDEAAILSIDRQAEVLNCGIAAYDFDPDAQGVCIPELSLWNLGAALEVEGATKTAAPDAVTGTR